MRLGSLQLEFHGEIVGSGNRLPLEFPHVKLRYNRARLATAESQDPVKGVLDIMRSQGPAVHRRLVVPEDAVADLEHVGERIRGLPALSQLPG